jgi:hypothetical protein
LFFPHLADWLNEKLRLRYLKKRCVAIAQKQH